MSYELHTKSKEIQTVFTQENEHMKLQAKQAQISNKMTTNNNETSSRDKMCFELCCRKKVISYYLKPHKPRISCPISLKQTQLEISRPL